MIDVPNVGETPKENSHRDAIHVAVIPVIAAHVLWKGDKVNINASGEAYTVLPGQKYIGIVDPFLALSVQPGQRFWLFMLSQTVTNLRHAWSHEAFKAKPLEEIK